jgi:hypothetical protein
MILLDVVLLMIVAMIETPLATKVVVVAEAAVVSVIFHPVGWHMKTDHLPELDLTTLEMISMFASEMTGRNENETAPIVVHLRSVVDIEVVLLIRTIEVGEAVEEEDVVIFKAIWNRELNRVLLEPGSQMASRLGEIMIEEAKVVSDLLFLSTPVCFRP